MAIGILSGKFQYCQDCDDYYLAKSFLSDSETKNARICIYQDPINSGGNDYADGYVDIKYSICPKGHKHEVSRKERTPFKKLTTDSIVLKHLTPFSFNKFSTAFKL